MTTKIRIAERTTDLPEDAKLVREVAGRTPEHRMVPIAENQPRISCMIGEKLWEDRWGRKGGQPYAEVTIPRQSRGL